MNLNAPPYPIFDGHNDTLLNLHMKERGQDRSFFAESDVGHIDLPRAQRGGLIGGFFAIFVPNPKEERTIDPDSYPGDDMNKGAVSYDIPMPPKISLDYATRETMAMIRMLYQLEKKSEGRFAVVKTAAEITQNRENGVTSAILHFEGADVIDPDLNALYTYYAAGLRSLGLVWSRHNAFGHGVPFSFPQGPDTGPGLTDAGRRLIQACNELGILIDLSHLNEKGFWDVEKISDAPLVATHSSAHALCPTPRNLTDKQLAAIKRSNGAAGVNYHIGFLRADGRLDPETSLAEIVRHVVYMAEKMGVDHVALGSDFDGATMPADLKDAAGLPKLMNALKTAGFNNEELAKIGYGNWERVLKATWK